MSVAVVITYRPGHDGPDYLPLATEQGFHAHWLPLATAAGLAWLPAFTTGTNVALEDLPAVVEELRRLAALAASSERLRPEVRAELVERAERAQGVLDGLDRDAVAEIFIG